MEALSAKIHQIGNDLISLTREKADGSGEHLALIEGGGICLANSFDTPAEADDWLRTMFERLYPGHCCGLGCVRIPGWTFLAEESDLLRLVAVEDRRAR